MARPGLRVAFAASFVLGAVLGAGACNEKKGAETAANADANAKADAAVTAEMGSGANTDVEAGAGAATDAGAPTDSGAATDSSTATADGAARHTGDASASIETSAHGDGGAKSAPVTIDESAAGKTIELAAGQSMTLSLGANATTGFDWSVTKAPAALGAPEMSYVQGGSQMGAPGTRKITWTLKSALPAGEHAVELAYARSFEKGVAPFKTFKLKVRAAH